MPINRRLRALPLLLLLTIAPMVQAQGVMQPLSIQGVEHQDPAMVRSRGMGSVFAATAGTAESVVLNPAGLAGLPHPMISASGIWRSRNWAETQHWNPNRYYAGLSLFFADPESYRTDALSVPDWTHSQSLVSLAAAGGAWPLRLTGRALSVGLMIHQTAYLADYDQNNNVLDPYSGQFRPNPVERPRPGEEIVVHWSEFERERTGQMRAVTAAAGYALSDHWHIGARLARHWGASTDRQVSQSVGQFILREDAHDWDHEALSGRHGWEGLSDFSSWRGALGVRVTYPIVSAGLTYEFAGQVRRAYTRSYISNNPQALMASLEGTDTVTIPARVTIGIAVQPSSDLLVAADYFWQNYEELEAADYTTNAIPDWGRTRGVGLGAEWAAWSNVSLRAGFRRDPRPFRIEGFGLVGQTAAGDAFSTGFSAALGRITVELAYEYQRLRYQDRWESNVDYNRIRQHNLLMGAAYRI